MSESKYSPSYRQIAWTGDISPVLAKSAGSGDDENYFPWHMLDRETEKAYAAFLVYLDMGRDRTISKLANVLYGNPDAIRGLGDWARDNEWVERARAWDTYISETRIEQMEKSVSDAEQMGLRHLPSVVLNLCEIATGKKKDASRQEVAMIKDFMDRFGPAKQRAQAPVQINNYNVNVPSLPDQITKSIEEAEDADYEEINQQAESLIPKSLREKRL